MATEAPDLDIPKVLLELEAARAKRLPPGNEVVEALVAALRDKDAGVRARAAWALGQIIPRDAVTKEVIETLLGLLRDKNAEVRERAAWALEAVPLNAVLCDVEVLGPEQVNLELTPLGNEVVVGLLAARDDENGNVSRVASQALKKLPPPSPEVVAGQLAALRDEDPVVRRRAVGALGTIAPRTRVSTKTMDLLCDYEEPGTRGENGWFRIEMDQSCPRVEEAASVIKALAAALCLDQDPLVRAIAATSLEEVTGGYASADVMTALLSGVQSREECVRRSANKALALIFLPYPYADAETVEVLMTALGHKDLEVRRCAADGLGNVALPDGITSQVVDALVQALGDEDADVRAFAAQSLGNIKDGAAIPALRATLQDKHAEVCRVASLALRGIGVEIAKRIVDFKERIANDQAALEGIRSDLTDLRDNHPSKTVQAQAYQDLSRLQLEADAAPEPDAVISRSEGERLKKQSGYVKMYRNYCLIGEITEIWQDEGRGVFACQDLAHLVRHRYADAFPDLKDFGPSHVFDCLDFVERACDEDSPDGAPKLVNRDQEERFTFNMPLALKAWETAVEITGRRSLRQDRHSTDPFPPALKGKKLPTLNKLHKLAELLLAWPTDEANCIQFHEHWMRQKNPIDICAKQVTNYFSDLEELCGPLTVVVKHGLPKRFLPQAKERLAQGIIGIGKAIAWHRGSGKRADREAP